MKINTGIKTNNKFMEILNSVIGQMSDGLWENSNSMKKYWQSLSCSVDPDGYIIIEDRHNVCTNPADFLANKIKQVIKAEAVYNPSKIQWSRTCPALTEYLSYTEKITIGDCYKLYEMLKGRDITKYTYATLYPYHVEFEFKGTTFEIEVEAPNDFEAKYRAFSEFTEKVVSRAYKQS